MTERDLLDALWRRLSRRQMSGARRYVMAEHVRHDPTYGRHIADALAVDTWGSGKWALEGYEVKCSRSDWRKELAPGLWHERGSPDLPVDVPFVKSYPWRRHCARWYILAPAGIVPRDELPPGWGLIEAHHQRNGLWLTSVVRAANTPAAALPLGPRQVAGLMRAVQATAERHTR